jgi:uncharacterized protein (TIGR02271 family)
MKTVSDRQVVAAYFQNQSDAENAIRDLKSAGFRSDQVGCSCDDVVENAGSESTASAGHDRRSFWQKVEGFFSGEEGYEDRDTGANDGRYNEGLAVGPTLSIPDRYHDRLSSGGTLVTVHDNSRGTDAEQILIANHGEIDRDFYTAGNVQRETADVTRDRARVDADVSRDHVDVENERRIQLLSERLRVNKERVQQGEVRLRKEVRTETQNIEVPVTHEELVIERVPVSGERAATGQIGANDEIRVPLSEQRVNVEKRPVVREEVRVGKKVVEKTQNVTDQVRHEELKVDDERNLANRDIAGRNHLDRDIAATDTDLNANRDLDRNVDPITGRRKIA